MKGLNEDDFNELDDQPNIVTFKHPKDPFAPENPEPLEDSKSSDPASEPKYLNPNWTLQDNFVDFYTQIPPKPHGNNSSLYNYLRF